jgi:L-ascorbate metabolism protein UlaG (beta-lactamase superfamily)
MKLTWFGHSAFRLDLADAVVLIDPFITNPTFHGDQHAAWTGTTHVVLTHGHDDHIGNTVQICEATGAMLIANPEVCSYLRGKGVEAFSPMNHGGTVDFGAFSVTLVPAWHSSSTTVDGKPVYLGNPAGVVIKAPGERTLLHMGDTDIFPGMALISEIHEPKIGIVPIGDRFTMGARTAALACRRFFKFDAVVPAHYGTFPILDQSADAFLHEMRGSDTHIVVPERGLAVEF